VQQHRDSSIARAAIFDSTGTYRYSLWRQWNAAFPQLVLVMLNPSTADAHMDDATIRRCIRFAQHWGYGSLEVVNLFAWMTPNPLNLRDAVDPVGTENDRHILTAVQRAAQVVVAWGNWGTLHQRDRAVLALLSQHDIYCLGINRSGQPRHPLYLKSSTIPRVYSRMH
jgi:hypothetical protein